MSCVQALVEQQQVLIASGSVDITDSCRAQNVPVKLLYVLTPCAHPPCLLLRHLACREQLRPLSRAEDTASLAAEDGEQAAAVAAALLAEVTDAGADLAWMTSGCHNDLQRWLTGQVRTAKQGVATVRGL